MTPHEIIGRLTEEKMNLEERVNWLAQVVRDLKSGNRSLKDIQVAEDGSFTVEPSKSYLAAVNGHAKDAVVKA